MSEEIHLSLRSHAERLDDLGQRTAALEAQQKAHMENTRDDLQEMKRNVHSMSNRVWGMIVLLLGNLLAMAIPKISAALGAAPPP